MSGKLCTPHAAATGFFATADDAYALKFQDSRAWEHPSARDHPTRAGPASPKRGACSARSPSPAVVRARAMRGPDCRNGPPHGPSRRAGCPADGPPSSLAGKMPSQWEPEGASRREVARSAQVCVAGLVPLLCGISESHRLCDRVPLLGVWLTVHSACARAATGCISAPPVTPRVGLLGCAPQASYAGLRV